MTFWDTISKLMTLLVRQLRVMGSLLKNTNKKPRDFDILDHHYDTDPFDKWLKSQKKTMENIFIERFKFIFERKNIVKKTLNFETSKMWLDFILD